MFDDMRGSRLGPWATAEDGSQERVVTERGGGRKVPLRGVAHFSCRFIPEARNCLAHLCTLYGKLSMVSQPYPVAGTQRILIRFLLEALGRPIRQGSSFIIG